ncbi:hypothetical protein [Rhizobium rhizogenes]|jgi:hypothetical protein
MTRLAAILLLLLTASPSLADMSSAQMEAAIGLAGIIGNTQACSYEIDQKGLDRYFVSMGLSSPEGLSYVKANIARNAKAQPSQSECTLYRATASSIGVLAAPHQ